MNRVEKLEEEIKCLKKKVANLEESIFKTNGITIQVSSVREVSVRLLKTNTVGDLWREIVTKYRMSKYDAYYCSLMTSDGVVLDDHNVLLVDAGLFDNCIVILRFVE